ncbi:MAG: 5'/3'-nucleotidase SurE [Rhodospirillaceae bacterium]|nr:5'/3'-nucleotidase SurE [Rhodospirillaceae bacterium]
MTEGRPPRILLTNDDGLNAAGLGELERLARELSDDVWLCAPATEQSAASHSLTIHRPLRLREVGEQRFTVDGTPTDCVLLAINHILADRKPDLVLSGINHGFNIGEDVTYSGTIAAAMEATLLGIRSMALSQEMADRPIDFATVRHWAPGLLRQLIAAEWPRNVLININFPARGPQEVTGVAVARHGNRKIGDELTERLDPRGRTYFWIGTARSDGEIAPDTDVFGLQSGKITVTPLFLDLTHYPTIQTLQQALS